MSASSVCKIGKTSKESERVLVPSGATKASETPAANEVVTACLGLVPRAACPILDDPSCSALRPRAVVALRERSTSVPAFAALATCPALPKNPTTGIKAEAKLVMPSAALPAPVCGSSPKYSLKSLKVFVTAREVSVPATKSIPAAPSSAIPCGTPIRPAPTPSAMSVKVPCSSSSAGVGVVTGAVAGSSSVAVSAKEPALFAPALI